MGRDVGDAVPRTGRVRAEAAAPERRRADLSVLRICSVFEPPRDLALAAVSRFDPIGGMQNHTASLTRALDRMGVRQTVVTTWPPGAPRRQRVGDAAEVLRFGLPIRPLRQLYAPPAAARVARASSRVDVIHVHLGEDLAIVPLGLLAMRTHRAPMLMTIHCSLAHTFVGSGARGLALRTIGGWLEHVGVRRSAEVIAIQGRTARALGRLRPGHVHVIPPGIERAVFEGRHDDPLPGVPHPRVLFVGRLAEQKGVWFLVDAMSHLPPPAHLVLVGDGPQREAIEAQVRARGIEDRVTITGFVHHAEVPAHMSNADVLVLPSVYEELGSVLIEAMAAGIPVVGNRAGGIPAVVRDGDNGLLCDCSDAASLAATIDRVLRDDTLRRRLVDGGAATAAEHDWDALAARTLALYERSIGRDAADAAAGSP